MGQLPARTFIRYPAYFRVRRDPEIIRRRAPLPRVRPLNALLLADEQFRGGLIVLAFVVTP